jgi:diguanylate cyclase (GGDEF)-like protein
LDYFKAYNDAYGFTSGDLRIKALSNAMQECSERQDFIGHIGGDDFVLIRNDYDKLYELCQRIGETFRKHINPLYSREDWERGYILSNNRNGFQQNFPIVTISIAVVSNRSQRPSTMEELSKIIAETKKKAKQIEGNSIIIV